jgi:hypothetical protein
MFVMEHYLDQGLHLMMMVTMMMMSEGRMPPSVAVDLRVGSSLTG